MKKRGSYFFVIDAIFAGLVLFVTIIYILNTYTNVPDTTTLQETTNNYVDYLVETELRDTTNAYVIELINNNLANDTTLSIAQQILILREENFTTESVNLIRNVTEEILDDRYNAQFMIDGSKIYERSYTDKDGAQAVYSAKKIIFARKSNQAIYGPKIIEGILW